MSPGGINNTVAAKGQTITLPGVKSSSLRLLGTGVNGTQTGSFTVYYTDGSSDTITRTFDDWYASANAPGETLAKAMPYRNQGGSQDHRTFNVYSDALPVNPTKTVAKVVLPNNPNIDILALDLLS